MIKLRTLLEKIIGGPSALYADKVEVGPRVTAAAWLDPIGDIYTGDTHAEAAERAAREGEGTSKDDAATALKRNWFQPHEYLNSRGWKDGFLTSDGDWITREQALIMAKKAKQLKQVPKGRADLDSADMTL